MKGASIDMSFDLRRGDQIVVLGSNGSGKSTLLVPELRGRGIATDLIVDAPDDIRERGQKVTVPCPVVAAFMKGNPQYADLIDSEHPGRWESSGIVGCLARDAVRRERMEGELEEQTWVS